jgi:LmbE family N-acetylglucosaminyl deacetylase
MRVLVIAAHPDDEVLGCGATMARHVEQGDSVEILILGTGALSRAGAGPAEPARLAQQAKEAARLLGVRHVKVLDLPDNRFDSLPLLEIVKRVEGEIERASPDTVYTHHSGDLNIDHRRTFEAVLTASRPQRSGGVKRILSFEVPSSTEWQAPSSGAAFMPSVFVDVARTIDRKVSALSIYSQELRPFPHPRSTEGVRALAAWRGASAGFAAAEAFVLVRERL